MSHIPNSAMPHAAPQAEPESPEGAESRLGQLAEKVREYPRTAAVAGAAVVGLAAAAAIPAIRSLGRGEEKGRSRKKKSG